MKHFCGQGSLSPVRSLERFIGTNIAVVREQVGVGQLGHAESPGCSVGVEEVMDMNVEVSLKPFGIHLCAVHNLNDG